MKRTLRTIVRPRWLLLVGVLAATAAVALVASSAASSSEAVPVSNPAHPVVDTNWIYAHDWEDATKFIYKVAGADGCLPGATSCGSGTQTDPSNNLPQNYNGAQEFYSWWKDIGTSSTPQPNGKLGKWISARDHLFPTRIWQLNDAELTIPGAICAGQQVMLASHNDATPVNNVNPGTSLTPLSGMHSGNWGNGSAYDANMGENMNLEELGSVLRWHEVNGTYPARTIKATLYDNEEGGLVGSSDYSAAGGGATLLTAPASAGATNIKVASAAALNSAGTSGIFAVGQPVAIDDASTENNVVASVGSGARTATTLAAASVAGDTNIKVTSVTNFVVGEQIRLETLGNPNQEWDTVQSVGTAGSGGTGITLTAPLANAHASGTQAQDLGTGITLSTPLAQAHPAASTVSGPTTGLMSDSPQGQIVGVLNNDQDGLNYPALHWGSPYYFNDLVNGGVGPWFNNINATPTSPAANNIYGTVGIQRLQHNLAAVQAFRSNVESSVSQALADLGQKYNYSMPVENPLQLKNAGSTPDNPSPGSVPSYAPADQGKYTPVLDDRTGRTDQVSFGVRGIPSLGDIGQYDSSTDPLVGGNENPYPSAYPSKPTISGMFGQDSTSDYFSNLNFWASGTVHGPGGYDQPSEGLTRGVEFIATWFSYAIASPALGSATAMPHRPIAYFEMSPKKATATRTVSFDAGFSRTASGTTEGLTYYWSFGDGTPVVSTTNPLIQHTFPQQAGWYDVKLLVAGAGQWNDPDKFGSFRQVEPINFFPTYYPAVAPASEPLPPSSGPAADPCGALSAQEQTDLIAAARDAKRSNTQAPTPSQLASIALTKGVWTREGRHKRHAGIRKHAALRKHAAHRNSRRR